MIRSLAQVEAFPLATRPGPFAIDASREHSGIVEDQQILGTQQRRQITNAMVLNRFRCPLDDKKPCILTGNARLLSYQFGWQVVIELTYLKFFSHSSIPFSAAATLLAGPTRRMV